MDNLYIIILSNAPLNREEIIAQLEKKITLSFWEYCLPATIFIKSPNTAREISDDLDAKNNDSRHLVLEVKDSNYWGRLPKGYWEIFGLKE